MPIYAGQTLRALRLKIGLTQFELAFHLRVSVITVKRHENKGTDNADYVSSLLLLVESRAHLPVSLLRRGRPSKPWKLRRNTNPDQAKFILYMENEPDDLKPLAARPRTPVPTDCRTIIVWLERDNLQTTLWRKMSIDISGIITQWTMVRY